MNVFTVLQNINHIDWDTYTSHPLQTLAWGNAKETLGTKVIRIAEYEDERLKKVHQMTLHAVHPFFSAKLGYIQRGTIPTKDLLDFLYKYAKEHNIFFIKFEPNQESNTQSQNEISVLMNRNKNFTLSKHPLFPQWTMKLDLKPSLEELKKNLHPKNRYNIGLAERKGVVVKEMTDDENGIKDFLNLFFATTKRQHYSMHNEHYHKIVFDYMKKSNIAHILTSYFQEIPLASYELFLHKDVLYYPYGGSADIHRNLMGANLLMWKAIEFGKKNNALIFDMWGAMDPKEYEKKPNDSWAGFTRFKLQFNAQFTQMIGSYDLVINPILYKLYTLAWKLRKL